MCVCYIHMYVLYTYIIHTHILASGFVFLWGLDVQIYASWAFSLDLICSDCLELLLLNAHLHPNERARKGMDLSVCGGREELGGAGGRETIIKTYCIKICFQFKKKKKVMFKTIGSEEWRNRGWMEKGSQLESQLEFYFSEIPCWVRWKQITTWLMALTLKKNLNNC